MTTISRTGPGGALRFQMAVVGQEPVDVALSRFGEHVADWRPFFREELAPKIYDDIQRNFETEGGFVGRWAPLSELYRIWKEKNYPGKSILQRTGALKSSMTQGGPGSVYRDTPQSMELGTTVFYGRYHQTGTKKHRKQLMPQRRFLFLVEAETYGRMLHRWTVGVARAQGLGASMRRASPSSGLL